MLQVGIGMEAHDAETRNRLERRALPEAKAALAVSRVAARNAEERPRDREMVEEVQPRADLQRRRFRSLRRVGWRGERNAT